MGCLGQGVTTVKVRRRLVKGVSRSFHVMAYPFEDLLERFIEQFKAIDTI